MSLLVSIKLNRQCQRATYILYLFSQALLTNKWNIESFTMLMGSSVLSVQVTGYWRELMDKRGSSFFQGLTSLDLRSIMRLFGQRTADVTGIISTLLLGSFCKPQFAVFLCLEVTSQDFMGILRTNKSWFDGTK